MGQNHKSQGHLDEILIQQKQAKIAVLVSELERRLKAVALGISRETFAALNDRSYSYVSQILNTNSEDAQRPFQVSLIPSLVEECPDRFVEEVINWFCDLCGFEHPARKKSLTPEEELEIYKRKIKEHRLEPLFDDIGASSTASKDVPEGHTK